MPDTILSSGEKAKNEPVKNVPAFIYSPPLWEMSGGERSRQSKRAEYLIH